jgi:hypothetical protein
VDATGLPTSLEDMRSFMLELLPSTQAALDHTGKGAPEWIVLRDNSRTTIAKAKFSDYERTLNQPCR